MAQAKQVNRIDVDEVALEALRWGAELPVFANIIDCEKTVSLSALKFADLGFPAIMYPWKLAVGRLRSARDELEEFKKGRMARALPKIHK